MLSLEQILALPVDTPLSSLDRLEDVAATDGPSWWQGLEVKMREIPCAGCRERGLSLLSGMRDLINHEMGKPLFDEENFAEVVWSYMAAAEPFSPLNVLEAWLQGRIESVREQIAGAKSTGESARLGGEVTAYQAVVERLKGLRREGFTQQYKSSMHSLPHSAKDPWVPEPGDEPDEDEDDEFMNKIIEALKREGKMDQSLDVRGLSNFLRQPLHNLVGEAGQEFHLSDRTVATFMRRYLRTLYPGI